MKGTGTVARNVSGVRAKTLVPKKYELQPITLATTVQSAPRIGCFIRRGKRFTGRSKCSTTNIAARHVIAPTSPSHAGIGPAGSIPS